MRAILTVVGRDQVGIIAKVTTQLASLNVNVLDVSQTILNNNFTMMMVVSLPDRSQFETLRQHFIQLGDDNNLKIHLQNEELFNAMHKL